MSSGAAGYWGTGVAPPAPQHMRQSAARVRGIAGLMRPSAKPSRNLARTRASSSLLDRASIGNVSRLAQRLQACVVDDASVARAWSGHGVERGAHGGRPATRCPRAGRRACTVQGVGDLARPRRARVDRGADRDADAAWMLRRSKAGARSRHLPSLSPDVANNMTTDPFSADARAFTLQRALANDLAFPESDPGGLRVPQTVTSRQVIEMATIAGGQVGGLRTLPRKATNFTASVRSCECRRGPGTQHGIHPR